MEYHNNTPICRRNKHLNQFERSKIEVEKYTSSYFAETGHIIYTRNRKNRSSKYKLFKFQNFFKNVYKPFYENKHSFYSRIGSCNINKSLGKVLNLGLR